MKERTHIAFTFGLVFFLTPFILKYIPVQVPFYLMIIMPFLFSYSVNKIIDTEGHEKHYTQEGLLPVRSWITHDVFTAPIWGTVMAVVIGLMSWELWNYPDTAIPPPWIVYCVVAGVISAYSHLFLDSLTQAGVFASRKRVAIAHWRYNSPFENLLFISLGLVLFFLGLHLILTGSLPAIRFPFSFSPVSNPVSNPYR